jgi:hypothetical protein
MSGAVLATAVKGDFVAAGMVLNQFNEAFIDSLCDRIVAHIQTNAQVIVTSVSGVTTGVGISGPGTGTIT